MFPIQYDVGDLRWQMDASPLWRGVPGQIWRRERGVRFSSETTVPGRGAEKNTAVQKALHDTWFTLTRLSATVLSDFSSNSLQSGECIVVEGRITAKGLPNDGFATAAV